MNRRLLGGLSVLTVVAACAGPVDTAPYPGDPWTDPDGQAVPPGVLALYSDDCPGRESAGLLEVLWPLVPVPGVEPERRMYVRDPQGQLPTSQLLAPYDRAGSLPRGALFTGYESPAAQLWVAPDEETYLYLVYGSRVEALPRVAGETVPCP